MPAKKQVPQPSRLKNLDALYEINGGINPLEQQVPPVSERQEYRCAPSTVEIEKLKPFRRHPFKLYEGERLDDMVESIRINGVLVPIIARKTEWMMEILAGHNRVNAARIVGLTAVPAIVLENVPDDEALVYVIETNLMQRSFADMAHSEKAAVIALQHSKLFSQGKRNDILRAMKMLENPDEYKADETSSQVENKMTSIEKVGESYSLSKDTVARYLRINQLAPTLKARLDRGDFAFMPAVTLSFLKKDEQARLDKCLEVDAFAVDMKKADILRQYSEKGKLDDKMIYRILNGDIGQKPKPNRTPVVKINKAVYARYFKPNQPAREIEEIVEKALELYFG